MTYSAMGGYLLPDDPDLHHSHVFDITAEQRRGKHRSTMFEGWYGHIFEAEDWYSPLAGNGGGSVKPHWSCLHDHPTKAEALTCAYDRLVTMWPGQ